MTHLPTALERNKYIKEVVISEFLAMVDADIYATLFDVEGKVLICTNKNARSAGFNSWHEVIGMSFDSVNETMIRQLTQLESATQINQILAACKIICDLQQSAVKNKQVVNFIDLIPYNNQFRVYLETLLPVFHPCGEVIAVKWLTVECPLLRPFNLFCEQSEDLRLMTDQIVSSSSSSLPKLSKRQHEILYLILQGFSQQHVAMILKIKRGTIARIISEKICPKFDINGANTQLLIKRATDMNLHTKMPPSLWQPRIILLK